MFCEIRHIHTQGICFKTLDMVVSPKSICCNVGKAHVMPFGFFLLPGKKKENTGNPVKVCVSSEGEK